MFKNPFKDQSSRIKYYLCVSIVCATIVSILDLKSPGTPINYVFYIFQFVVYIVIALGSLFYARNRVQARGMSSQVRRLVLRRHLTYIMVYFVTSLYVFATAITYVDNPSYDEAESKGTGWKASLKILFFA